jgi:hypothetical protein
MQGQQIEMALQRREWIGSIRQLEKRIGADRHNEIVVLPLLNATSLAPARTPNANEPFAAHRHHG